MERWPQALAGPVGKSWDSRCATKAGRHPRCGGTHERLVEWEGRMIRLFTAWARIALVAVAMTVTVPMITFPQTSQTTTEGEPAAAEAAVANAGPTSDENSTDNDTSVKTGPPAKSPIPVAVENELRRELLDNRAAYIDRWLSVIAIVFTFFRHCRCGARLHRLQTIPGNRDRNTQPRRKTVSIPLLKMRKRLSATSRRLRGTEINPTRLSGT